MLDGPQALPKPACMACCDQTAVNIGFWFPLVFEYSNYLSLTSQSPTGPLETRGATLIVVIGAKRWERKRWINSIVLVWLAMLGTVRMDCR